MKYSFTTITIFICFLGISQERHRLSIGTQGGYEYNYFKSPDELVITNDSVLNEEDLIASSTYQDVFLDYAYRKKWKANRLRLSVSPYARLFQENPTDSYWSLDATLKYDRKLSKKTKALAELHFKRMDREGLDGAQDVLVNPLGFTNYGASAGLETQLLKGNKSTLGVFYNFKDFDAYGVRDLEFNEYGVRMASKQEYRPGRYEHVFGFNAYYKKRLYTTLNSEETPQNGQRDWDYFKMNVFYKLPLGAYFNVSPQLTYYGRFDRLENRSGFHQYGPALRLRYNNNKTKVTVALKYQVRDYTEIMAPGTNDALRYTYADASFSLERKLPVKGLLLSVNAYSRFRETNTEDLAARSFRGYTNQYAGMGFVWKLLR